MPTRQPVCRYDNAVTSVIKFFFLLKIVIAMNAISELELKTPCKLVATFINGPSTGLQKASHFKFALLSGSGFFYKTYSKLKKATPERRIPNGSVRLPYTSHARHLKIAPFPGCDPAPLPQSYAVGSRSPSTSISGSADSDTSPFRMQRQKPRLKFNAFRLKGGIYFSAQETRG
ncbi:hypothetical protein CDAR_319711 [Caerostris darwini]|uniref:Uncharacterized protein n=1 Tax=Caerostris darwini TaxID=1538125 RepID=A0AAV4M7C1_9ARAC|nr:hypothetical protein CDAR_319711 [Caerostris darwini]